MQFNSEMFDRWLAQYPSYIQTVLDVTESLEEIALDNGYSEAYIDDLWREAARYVTMFINEWSGDVTEELITLRDAGCDPDLLSKVYAFL